MDILKKEVLKDLPAELHDENLKLTECRIENAILSFSKNPYISGSITEDMLNSPCVLDDFNAEDDNLFMYTPGSAKRQHFNDLYHCIFKEIMNSNGKMPTVSEKNTILNMLAEIAKVLVNTEKQDLAVLENMIQDLNKITIGLPIDNLVKLIQNHIPDFKILESNTNKDNSDEHKAQPSLLYQFYQYGSSCLFNNRFFLKAEPKEDADISLKSTAVVFKK